MPIGASLRRRWEGLQSLPTWVLDAAIAIVGGGVTIASTFGPGTGDTVYQDHDAVSYALLAVFVLPYFVRRRYPFAAFSISAVALIIYASLGYNEGALPTLALVGMYTVGALCRPRLMVAAFAILVGGLALLWVDDTSGFDVGDLVGNVAFFAAALMFGWTIQSRRLRLEALVERAEALEREQAEEARRAVADERLRIAQELHDVMAHSMGVIAVQAGAGMHVIDKDPAEAKRALENISTTSRSTLTELRRLLGVLRDETDGAAHAPAPGLDELPRLARDMQEAGLPVDLRVDEPLDVPAGVDLTAYRIVQEALTNALKHAGPARASVDVVDDDGTLRIEVRDDGRGVNGSSDGTGHGLLGMRERVAVYGGTLSAGPVAGGGYRVTAALPWHDDSGGVTP